VIPGFKKLKGIGPLPMVVGPMKSVSRQDMPGSRQMNAYLQARR